MKKNKSKIYAILLGLIIVFAFFVRFSNIKWSLDKDLGNWTSYPDEPYGYAAAFNFAPFSGEFRTSNWALIKGTFYYEVIGTLNQLLEISGFKDLMFQNSNIASDYNNYLLARAVSLLFSLIIIFLIYRFCVYLFKNEKIGLLASFTYAIFAHEVPWSTLITGDILATLLSLLTIYLCLVSLRSREYKYLFLTSFIAGLAIGTKYSLFVLVIPVALSLFLLDFKNWKSFNYFKFIKYGVLLALCFFIGLFIAVPDIIFHNADFVKGLEIQKNYQTGEFADGINQLPRFIFYFSNVINYGIGVVLAILSVVGTAYFAWQEKKRRETWIISSFIFSYYIVISTATWITTRYTLILMPFFAIFIGYLFVELYKRTNWKKSFLFISLVLYAYNLAFLYNFIDMIAQPTVQDQFEQYQKDSLHLSDKVPEISFVMGYQDEFTYPVKMDYAATAVLLREIEINPNISIPGKYLLISSFHTRNAKRIGDKSMTRFIDRLEGEKEFRLIKIFDKTPIFGDFFGRDIFYSNDLEIYFQKFYLYQKL